MADSDDDQITAAQLVSDTVDEICQANECLPLGWVLIIEGAPAEGGESLAMFTPATQAVHRTLGQVAYAQQWFNNEVLSHWHATTYEDDD